LLLGSLPLSLLLLCLLLIFGLVEGWVSLLLSTFFTSYSLTTHTWSLSYYTHSVVLSYYTHAVPLASHFCLLEVSLAFLPLPTSLSSLLSPSPPVPFLAAVNMVSFFRRPSRPPVLSLTLPHPLPSSPSRSLALPSPTVYVTSTHKIERERVFC